MFEPPYRIKNMVPGMIMLWYGSIATVPTGWALCDGTNGTPNLRDVYVKGAGIGAPNQPGVTGGSESHSHPFTGDGHAHDLISGDDIDIEISGGNYAHTTNTNPASGDTDVSNHEPPYHNLCYIMKTPIP